MAGVYTWVVDDRRDRLSRTRLRERIKAEFTEMPGLRLTREQAGRLWSMPCEMCERILAELEREGFVQRLSDGSFGSPDLGA
jgi:hypothetical protein